MAGRHEIDAPHLSASLEVLSGFRQLCRSGALFFELSELLHGSRIRVFNEVAIAHANVSPPIENCGRREDWIGSGDAPHLVARFRIQTYERIAAQTQSHVKLSVGVSRIALGIGAALVRRGPEHLAFAVRTRLEREAVIPVAARADAHAAVGDAARRFDVIFRAVRPEQFALLLDIETEDARVRSLMQAFADDQVFSADAGRADRGAEAIGPGLPDQRAVVGIHAEYGALI